MEDKLRTHLVFVLIMQEEILCLCVVVHNYRLRAQRTFLLLHEDRYLKMKNFIRSIRSECQASCLTLETGWIFLKKRPTYFFYFTSRASVSDAN